ncbi:MAG TPA: hypothetical protein VK795_09460 [Terriglobales bacterium]|nr:hypothetical protein [Terriglobales bacterium]
MAETAPSHRFGIVRFLATIILSIVTGFVIGFALDRVLLNWKALNDNLGWFLVLLPTYSIWVILWQRHGPEKRIDSGTSDGSETQIWRRPEMWSWALFMASAKFVNCLDDGRNLRRTIVEAAIFFMICYGIIVAASWLTSPAKWEREA